LNSRVHLSILILGAAGALALVIAGAASSTQHGDCPPNSTLQRVEITETEERFVCRCNRGFFTRGQRCERAEAAARDAARRWREEVRAGRATDCAALAGLIEEIGEGVYWNLDEMVRLVGGVVGGVRLRDVTLAPPAGETVAFGQSGFRPGYVDRATSDQVRHFIGYFALGAMLSGGAVAEIVAGWRDAREPGDYQLGIFAANLGQRMRQSPELLRGVGGAIRSSICR